VGGKNVNWLGMEYVGCEFVRFAGLIVTMVEGSGSAEFGVSSALVDTGTGDAGTDRAFARTGAAFNDDTVAMVSVSRFFIWRAYSVPRRCSLV